MARRRLRSVLAIGIAFMGGGVALAVSQSPVVVYSGLSAQRLPFTLAVAPDGRLSLDLAWSTSCRGVVRTLRAAATTIAANGEFAWSGTYVDDALGDGDEDRQRLRLVGRREGDGTLAGVWRGERDLYNGQGGSIDSTCSSGDVAFRLSRDGSTSQPAPQRDGAGHLVIPLGEEPHHVAVGAGKTWVLGQAASVSVRQQGEGILTAVDQRTGRATSSPLDAVGSGTSELAAGDGAAWLLKGGPPARLLRIDAGTARVVQGPRPPIPADRGYATGFAVGGGGVWVLLDGRVVRADPRDGSVVRSIRVPVDRRVPPQRRCTRPIHLPLIAVHRKDVWVMSRTALRCRSHASPRAFALARKGFFYSLLRLDARTNRFTRTVALTREYGALAAGPSGVWGIGCRSPAEIYRCRRAAVHRIDLRTGRSAVVVGLPADESLRTSQFYGPIGVGAGAVWLVAPAAARAPQPDRRNPQVSGVLQRIDVADPRLTSVRPVPRWPADLAVDEHGAWVLDSVDRTLIRVQS